MASSLNHFSLNPYSFIPILSQKKVLKASRYGFNGMEKDNEISGGDGNDYTTLFREYDPRLARWLSLDPKFRKFAWQSPYVAFDNNPILNSDPNGDAPGDEDKGNSKNAPIISDKDKIANKNILRNASKEDLRSIKRIPGDEKNFYLKGGMEKLLYSPTSSNDPNGKKGGENGYLLEQGSKITIEGKQFNASPNSNYKGNSMFTGEKINKLAINSISSKAKAEGVDLNQPTIKITTTVNISENHPDFNSIMNNINTYNESHDNKINVTTTKVDGNAFFLNIQAKATGISFVL